MGVGRVPRSDATDVRSVRNAVVVFGNAGRLGRSHPRAASSERPYCFQMQMSPNFDKRCSGPGLR
jgi:hypothetical protein